MSFDLTLAHKLLPTGRWRRRRPRRSIVCLSSMLFFADCRDLDAGRHPDGPRIKFGPPHSISAEEGSETISEIDLVFQTLITTSFSDHLFESLLNFLPREVSQWNSGLPTRMSCFALFHPRSCAFFNLALQDKFQSLLVGSEAGSHLRRDLRRL